VLVQYNETSDAAADAAAANPIGAVRVAIKDQYNI
jgi:hypothetical protein